MKVLVFKHWHRCSFSELSPPEEIITVYRFGKSPLPWSIRITTLFEYQTRRLTTKAVKKKTRHSDRCGQKEISQKGSNGAVRR